MDEIIGSSEFRRILYGCFLVARAQDVLEEILFKMLPTARNILGI